VTHELAFE
jgi:hypothetical protein